MADQISNNPPIITNIMRILEKNICLFIVIAFLHRRIYYLFYICYSPSATRTAKEHIEFLTQSNERERVVQKDDDGKNVHNLGKAEKSDC